jgi:hypothetical protein
MADVAIQQNSAATPRFRALALLIDRKRKAPPHRLWEFGR